MEIENIENDDSLGENIENDDSLGEIISFQNYSYYFIVFKTEEGKQREPQESLLKN
jgi:hypothetical protein